MFEHIVLLKLKPSVTIDEQEEVVKYTYTFKETIQGIVDISAGINITEEMEHKHGYTIGIRITFADQQACRDYIQHPQHQTFLKRISPIVEGIVIMDYPFA
ncbi:Dabb family protein [Metabacillus malikii]|uniref:Stress-response A/B barrel domain-containing protein n=1 Tax=Metabacillus malikii TaxID=1504265 RepID=A0ABT9ZAA6_9BACI|nr:Dabb family protein [Metabacillus malikii]MDQ0229171.1 hypothetical protein [Metabacillus malikii]